jgi:two-component system phosphate regulon sensor histidine kinase PhoR
MLSRLESQESAVVEEDVDMAALVRELTDEARALSGGRHSLGYEADETHVRGSRDELRSALGNLVSNAIRYTPTGGSIQLRWTVDQRGGAFSVEDTGIGIAPEHLPRLTERFYRVDKSRSRETGGTGLGLAIVKHVLLRHQARLTIESQAGQGSTFTAWLPDSRLIQPEITRAA